MKKFLLLIGIGILLAAVALAIAFDPTHIVLGFLRREQFYQGRPTSYWSDEVKRSAWEVHTKFALSSAPGPDAAGIPVLLELLHDSDDQVCFFAADALSRFDPPVEEAIPELVEWLSDRNVYCRRNAAHALATMIGPGDRDAIPGLIDGIKEDDVFLNYYCAIALGRIGFAAQSAIPALIELSKSDRAGHDSFGREATLGTVGEASEWALKEIDADAPHIEL